MKYVIQVVSKASVEVEGKTVKRGIARASQMRAILKCLKSYLIIYVTACLRESRRLSEVYSVPI